MNTINKFVLVWALGLTALILMGLTIPHAFAPGTTISSAQMNANFDAVKTAVDALEAQSATNTTQLGELSPESGLSPRQLQYARDNGLAAAYVEPTTGMRFVLIPPGEFWMGSPGSEVDRGGDEIHHHVRLTQAFYLAAHEVTNAQYRVKEAGHTSTADGDAQPVTEVSHTDAVAFAAWLSTQTGDTYGLPTEAQWEYACRAGTTTPFAFGENINPAQVNYNGNGPYNGAPAGLWRATTTDVGSFPANAWGLHDMHGNVWEWCADWYGAYSGDLVSVTTDPTGAAGPGGRVLRGGSWLLDAGFGRSAIRNFAGPTISDPLIGFRLARPVTP
ncbi:MAG: formylglycine-generating enzyme family protein [Planctomycetota bacterium]|nr:formylglycine-generating enzyme family protein [Planctomycetota bacterium]